MQTKRFKIVMECLHAIDFTVAPPDRGEVIWCPRCAEYRSVTTAQSNYNVRCQQCVYSRTFGRNIALATDRASAHVKKRPTHVVKVYDGLKLLETIEFNDSMLPMFKRQGMLDRLEMHQRILKDFVAIDRSDPS